MKHWGWFVSVLLLGFFLSLTASRAAHALTIFVDDGLTVYACADGNPCDTNPSRLRVTTIFAMLDGGGLSITSGSLLGVKDMPVLDLNATLTSEVAHTYTLIVSDEGRPTPLFSSPSLPYEFHLNGTTEGTIDATVFLNQVALVNLGPYSAGGFTGTADGAVNAPSPAYLSISTTLTHPAGMHQSSFDAEFSATPEPGTLWLLGSVGIILASKKQLGRKGHDKARY